MDNANVQFHPGGESQQPLPLARFLPPLPSGMVSAWLREHVEAGGWVIDPLNAAPAAALEAARAGYRVLVASNNPVLTFLLQSLASAPHASDFQAALAELGTSRRGEERLEVHLNALYRTACHNCAGVVAAQAFLWKKGEAAPYARVYRCPHCQAEGEGSLEPGDLQRLSLPGNVNLHRARALSRVAGPEDAYYEGVQEALASYLDRPLYALSTLINKQEGLNLEEAQRRWMVSLLISACDAASALWPYPGGRSRPRQLGVPSQFRENNVWLAMEEAIPAWSSQPEPLPLVEWPELPPPGGIGLYPGRIRGMLPFPEEVKPAAVLAVFPRPNQAFWTLSAMWAGWLWGRDAAQPLHALLERKRFDWAWHATAMHSPLAALARVLPVGTPLIGLLAEVAPGFLAAVFSAASESGFSLEGLALREDEEIAQGLWRSGAGGAGTKDAAKELVYQESAREVLEARAEPAAYLTIYAGGLAGLAQNSGLTLPAGGAVGDLPGRIQAHAGRAFADRSLVRRFEGGSQEDERSLWWLAQPPADLEEPLADRVEREVVRMLQRNPGIARGELEEQVCKGFPGLLTPPVELFHAILESYAEEAPSQPGRLRLMPQEAPGLRRADLEEARGLLHSIGERMGFAVTGDVPLVWTPKSFGQVYFFYPMASSLVSRYVLGNPPGPVRQCVMVFPGGRARLLSFKLRRDPRLAELLKGWHLLKFRHLRNLAERKDVDPEVWDSLLDADPPFFDEAEQMRLL